MKQIDYYKYPAISNSMLSEFEKKTFNIRHYGDKDKAYALGSMIHTMILEPHKTFHSDIITLSEAAMCRKVADNAKKHPLVKWLCQWSRKEQEYYWTEPTTGLPCKSKLDVIFKLGKIVVDLKTTSAKNDKEFIASIILYSYDRQAAFYLDACGGKRFIFIGLQKQEPYNIYVIELNEIEIFQGRKKYKNLMQLAQRMDYFRDILKRNEDVNREKLVLDYYLDDNVC